MAKQNYPSQLGQRDGLGAGRKLARLRLLPAEQIEFITSDGLPVFQPNAKFLEIEVAGTTSSFSENAGVSEPGAAYAWAVNFSLSKARPEVRDFIRRNILVRWVAFLQTVAGECQMVGFPDFPLQLQAGTSVGGGSNSSSFQLSGSGPEPALFLQGIDDDSLSGQGTFDAHFFSDVFNI